MTACEVCWDAAFLRAHIDGTKSQAEHYQDLLKQYEGTEHHEPSNESHTP